MFLPPIEVGTPVYLFFRKCRNVCMTLYLELWNLKTFGICFLCLKPRATQNLHWSKHVQHFYLPTPACNQKRCGWDWLNPNVPQKRVTFTKCNIPSNFFLSLGSSPTQKSYSTLPKVMDVGFPPSNKILQQFWVLEIIFYMCHSLNSLYWGWSSHL